MKLDLHIHTTKSKDCHNRVDQVIAAAEEKGLDAIAICDHNSMAAVDEARQCSQSVTIIPGSEITAQGGTHIIGLFLKNEISSREILDIIDEIHDQDGLVLLPHPFRSGTGLIYQREKDGLYDGEMMSRILTGVDLVEIINYRCRPDELVESDRYFAFHPDIPHVAGSDAHQLEEIGKAYVDLDCPRTADLNTIKTALLENDRQFRYEAYTADYQTKSLKIKTENRSLIIRTGHLVKDNLIKPLKSLYRQSFGRTKVESEAEKERTDKT